MTAWWPAPKAHRESALPSIIDPWTDKQAGNNRLSRPRRSRTRQVHHRFNRYQQRIRETPAHRHEEFGSA
jgi:hypothetical protein